jgi:uncharacterized phage protein gp47/JayE
MAFSPKSQPEIVASMAAKVAAETPINDFSPGSVILTLLEAAAQEDFQAYVAMLEIILAYNLDTTSGSDLDKRAFEYGLTRLDAQPHSGYVSIIDTRFDKVVSKIYAGLPGPTANSNTINVDDASEFPTTGSVYVGRGSQNAESIIAYSTAPVNNGSYWTITLDTNLLKDHGTDETVILAQFGDRSVNAGTEVRIPPNDFSEAVLFELNQPVTLLDGENRIDNVLVTALEPGAFAVPSDSVTEFVNDPFTDSAVTNPLPFVNGRDIESDQDLRDRIRDTIQSLSRGTKDSVRTRVTGLVDPNSNSRIVSTNVVPPVILADGPTKVYIDNGRGLEPELAPTGLETIITSANGGETFFQLKQFPLVKANVVSQLAEPFNLSGGETLIITVGNNEEVFTFNVADFKLAGKAKAVEVSEALNRRSSLIESRTITDASSGQRKIIITPIARENEDLTISDVSTAQPAFNFNTNTVFTAKLYKNDKLLSKDGTTASVITDAQPFDLSTSVIVTNDGDFTLTSGTRVLTKSAPGSGVNSILEQVHPGDYVKLTNDPDTFYTRVRTIVGSQKVILETAYPIGGSGTGNITIWNSPQLELSSNGEDNDTELVSFSPNDFSNAAQALASEVSARLDAEIHQSKVELAINSTRVKITSEIENSASSSMRVIGGGAAVELGFCSSSSLTGTVSVNGGSVLVTGVGTQFLTELVEGQWFKTDAHGKGSWTQIETIESDTVMYLKNGYRGANATGVSASKINLGNLEVGTSRDYVLNRFNGQLELTVPLEEGDSLTIGSINTRAFVDSLPETFDFSVLGPASTLIVRIDGGFTASVATGDGVAPYNLLTAENLKNYPANFFVGFHIEFTSGNNLGQTDLVNTYNPVTGQITLVNGVTNPILVSDKFTLSQVMNFNHAADFADPANVFASEVVAAINAQALGSTAVLNSVNNSVRLQTTSFNPVGALQILGGTANSVLNFSLASQANQETNLSFAASQNSDRGGLSNALGFTLGPTQSLVVIVDGDVVNKTFVIPTAVTGTVSVGGSGTFTASGLVTTYPTQGFFNDFWVYWTSGLLAGKLQYVTNYNSITGVFSLADVFPVPVGASSAGDTFSLVPRTAENVSKHLKNLNISTISTAIDSEVTGLSGDFLQLVTKTPGSEGKIFVSGGSANSLDIPVQTIVAGAPVNDLTVNSISGLAKGLPVNLRAGGAVTVGDAAPPFDTFTSAPFITGLPNYFTGLTLEFTSGLNAGHVSEITSYNNMTGQVVLTTPTANPIVATDSFVINRTAFVVDLVGTTAPYTVSLNDATNTPIDVSGYTSERLGTIADLNGLNFSKVQVEGTDGYKYFTGLIQLAQWTIDGLDRDPSNYPGIAAGGTQFEVIPPVLISVELTLNITTDEGVSLASVLNEVNSAVLGYVNSRKVGEEVILSEIIAAAQSVNGIFDVEITNQTENIVVADGELARLADENLVIG